VKWKGKKDKWMKAPNPFPQVDIYNQFNIIESLLKSSVEYVVICLNLKGLIIDCNNTVELVYEYAASELIGTYINKLYDVLESPSLKKILTIVKQSGQWKGEIISTTKKGKKHIDEVLIISRLSKKGKSIGYTLILQPLGPGEHYLQAQFSQKNLAMRNKELEYINTRMHEVSRLKDEFLANMSHDLRTPLNSIIGFAEIMHDNKVGPISNEHREYLEEIISSAQHLLLLINDILDLAKIEAGKMEFKPVKITLFPLVDELRGIFSKIIAEKHINFDIKIDPELTTIIDPNKLKQVLYNLVSNAFKFTPEGGSVTVRVSQESKDTFRLAVEDTGIGIDPKNFKQLFIAFQQLETGTTKKYPGTGLGLVMTRRIVEAQGGKIGVESKVGQGSIFYVILPYVAPRGKYGYVEELKHFEKKTPSILIIEDSSQERAELVEDIVREGYQVNIANNIEEALTNYQVAHADAIILDFFVPDISKWKLLRAFRTNSPFKKAPALLITGCVANTQPFGFKIHDFLVQPLKAQELVDALKWSGADPYSHKRVLMVDNDINVIKRNKVVLKKFGYHAQYESDLEQALIIIERERPDALIFNPFMESKNLNGIDFLHQLRVSERGRYTPILITTLRMVTADERERIKGVIQRVLLKKEGIANSLINEIKKQFPLSEKSITD
jgi:signal transduction histidine kinase/CheY-like chemotaxis protein